MIKMSKEMSEEAFNEIVDSFEYIRTLTEWGSKNIKQHIQKLQQENKHQKEVIDKIKTNIKNDMEGFMTINEHGEGEAMYDLLEIYLEILEGKEASE